MNIGVNNLDMDDDTTVAIGQSVEQRIELIANLIVLRIKEDQQNGDELYKRIVEVEQCNQQQLTL